MPGGRPDLAAEGGGQGLGAEADAEDGHAGPVRLAEPGQLGADPVADGGLVVDRPRGAEHDDVVVAVERRQRAVVGHQVHGQLGAAGREGRADESGLVDVVMTDHEHAHVIILP